jgi:hypothetical protein
MIISRLGSLLVAVGYLIAAFVSAAKGQEGSVIILALALLLPLALIWFPELFGNYLGPVRGGYIDHKTPGVLIAIAGWFFLVGIPLILYLLWRPRG